MRSWKILYRRRQKKTQEEKKMRSLYQEEQIQIKDSKRKSRLIGFPESVTLSNSELPAATESAVATNSNGWLRSIGKGVGRAKEELNMGNIIKNVRHLTISEQCSALITKFRKEKIQHTLENLILLDQEDEEPAAEIECINEDEIDF